MHKHGGYFYEQNTKQKLRPNYAFSIAAGAFGDLNKLKVLYHGPGVAFGFFLI